MKIAIVILNWNGKKHLEQFLPSVIENSKLEDCNVIIADNGSTDNSISFLKGNYPELQLILLDKNYGFAEGYNKALKQIESEYFVLLNSDVELTENWLEPIITKMDSNKNMAAAMPKILAYHDKSKFEHAGASGGFIDQYGYPFCRGRILDNIETDTNQHDSEIEIFWATGACLIIKSDIYNKLGGLDGDFFAHMEEIDLCWRIKSAGYSIKVFPESKVFHVGGGTLNSESPFKLYLNFRNNLFMLFKNLPAKKLLPILFFRMLLDGLSAITYLLSGNFKQFLAVPKAHFHFYSALPQLLKKRKKVQKLSVKTEHKEILKQSIVYNSIVLKRKMFDQITF